MLEKSVKVYLDTGAIIEHVLVAEDDNDYVKQINGLVNTIIGKTGPMLGFSTPLCFYKVQNIIAIEFSDPPVQIDKLPMGLIKPK